MNQIKNELSRIEERRKQRQQKRRKRRRAFRRFLLRFGAFVLCCLSMFFLSGLAGNKTGETLGEIWPGTLGGGIRLEMRLTEAVEAMAEPVSEEDIPESLLALLEKNPETRDFVMGYPGHRSGNEALTFSQEIVQGEIPLFLQWDERWGYQTYGNDFLALTGCGPTCLAMVRCGLSGNGIWDPYQVAVLAESEGYYVSGAGSSWDLMTEGAALLGLKASQVPFNKEQILNLLREGTPIICVMGPGDFTDYGHFIVLTGVTEDGKITLNDPNSRIRSAQTWELGDLLKQMKNLWAYSY